MSTATASNLKDAAAKMNALADRAGPYSRRGQIAVAGEWLGLTPTQARRLAYREWKRVPSEIMDRVRALYAETCEALDESARQKIEALDASSEKRRREHLPVDGEGDGPADELAEGEGEGDDADPNVND